MMEYFVGTIVLLIGFFFMYMLIHMEEEKREGRYLPLPWEQGGWMHKTQRKIFDKSDIKYRDGDNT